MKDKTTWEEEFDGFFFPEIGSTKSELQRHSARKDFIRDLLLEERKRLKEELMDRVRVAYAKRNIPTNCSGCQSRLEAIEETFNKEEK